LLEQQAKGDYSPDRYPDTFPEYVDQRHSVSTDMSVWDLFGAYVTARKPAAGTVNRWRAVFMHLQAAYPDRGARALTEDDARAWKDTLVTPKRSAVTVDAVWLPAAKTVFSWAVSQKRIRANPFAGVKVDVPKAVVLREEGKSFKPEEAQVILRASTAIANLKDAFPRAKRWVMWLCAYSGARSGEISQLRGIDVIQRGDFELSPGIILEPDFPKVDIAAASASARDFSDYAAAVTGGELATFSIEVQGATGPELVTKA
jgi:hypothetical protein